MLGSEIVVVIVCLRVDYRAFDDSGVFVDSGDLLLQGRLLSILLAAILPFEVSLLATVEASDV